jgi:hypothetical protein
VAHDGSEASGPRSRHEHGTLDGSLSAGPSDPGWSAAPAPRLLVPRPPTFALKAAFGTPSDSSASSSRPGSSTGQQPLSGATAWARRPHARGVSARMAVLHAPRLTPRPGGGHCATMAGAATLLKGNRHHPARRCLPRRRSCAADGCPTGCAITDGSPAHDDCPARRCAVRSRGWCEPWCPGGEASAFDEHPQRVEADAVVLPGLLHFVGLQHLLQLLKAGAFED